MSIDGLLLAVSVQTVSSPVSYCEGNNALNNATKPESISQDLDIVANRSARSWSRSELIKRFIWEVVRFPLFTMSPRPLWFWRRTLLRCFGARIGKEVHIFPSVKIAIPWNLKVDDFAAVGDGAIIYSLGLISIGERATISQNAHLCAGTHDHTDPTMPLLKIPIRIDAEAWVCADAFVGPGVTIGHRAVVGARAVAVSNIEDSTIAVGNPAKSKRKRLMS